MSQNINEVVETLKDTVVILRSLSELMSESARLQNENIMKLKEIKDEADKFVSLVNTLSTQIRYREAYESLAKANEHIENALSVLRRIEVQDSKP